MLNELAREIDTYRDGENHGLNNKSKGILVWVVLNEIRQRIDELYVEDAVLIKADTR